MEVDGGVLLSLGCLLHRNSQHKNISANNNIYMLVFPHPIAAFARRAQNCGCSTTILEVLWGFHKLLIITNRSVHKRKKMFPHEIKLRLSTSKKNDDLNILTIANK